MIYRPALIALFLTAVVAPAAIRWSDINRQPPDWYAGEEARAIAATVIQYQTKEGGWPKNTDMTQPPSAEFLASTALDHRAATIDNGGTTTQLRYLAQVITAKDDPVLRTAFERGFDYLLAAQYPNGGWPQYFPLRKGYYTHITYNDNAMVNVLLVLRDTARAKEPFAFVDADRRARAAAAVEKAVDCILRTQVRQDGKLTAWCAQHDETTFAPAPARNFEPVSLSGSESVGLVRFLMGIEHPSPEVIAAIEGAVAWFEAVRITGLQIDEFTGENGKRDRRAVPDAAAPPLWARFYELGTNRPIFIGRDKIIRYDLNEIEQERRGGYSYLSDWPANLLEKEYPRWRAKNHLP
jgi:PelA/Pel-15E family pectate lyase